MKNLKLFLLLYFIPFFGVAQSLDGVYTGVLSNDSNTIRKDQSFEMALTEYKGKVYGYAYSTFIVNDTLYYIVKRVKGTVSGDICEVEDDEVMSHNFPQKPEKKVFVTYTLRRNATDSVWRLDGNWKTNLTKRYYAISGKVEAKEEKDLSKSKLYEHLGDLDLQKTLAFNKPKETPADKKQVKAKDDKNAVAKNNVKTDEKKNQPTEIKPANNKNTEITTVSTTSTAINNQPNQTDKKDAIATNTVDKKPETSNVKTETKVPDNKAITAAANNQPVEKKDAIATNTVDKKPQTDDTKAETKVPDNKTTTAAVSNQPAEKKDTIVTNTVSSKTSVPDNKTAPIAINNQSNSNEKKNVVATNSTAIDKKPETTVTNKETKLPDNKPVVAANNQPNQNEKKNVTTTNVDKKSETNTVKTDTKAPDNKTATATANTQPAQKKDVAMVDKELNPNKADAEYEFQDLRRRRQLKPAASLVDERVSVPSETIFFKTDSLSIALYDNGEVDGDSVSVIINDEMFIEKQGLKSSAFRKTFYVPENEGDSLLIVLYAENLGKYPPNTGLLQIKDGDEIFYVRFKADLDRNAAIVLRRKTK